MRDKLEVGMYVRTKYGIEKIKFIDENFSDGDTTFVATDNDEFRGAYNGKFNGFTTRNDVILKASHNIIDILEVGDYVNGHKVSKVVIDSLCSFVLLEEVGSYVDNPDDIDAEDIKTIVTKEQFSSMEYKLGGKE